MTTARVQMKTQPPPLSIGQLAAAPLDILHVLDVIQDEARQADDHAREACAKSKYSIQDYHICVEFYLQRLHDRLAVEFNLSLRCPIFPFRASVAEFRQSIIESNGIEKP